jgi:GT2 family glycosyltransferase
LLEADVRFDERFTFHFYDLDFCKTASAAGLRLGTWPVAVTHASGGAFGGAAWQAAWERYRDKYKSVTA